MFRELLLLTVSDGVRLCICGGSDDIGTGDELRELADEQFGYTFAELGSAGRHKASRRGEYVEPYRLCMAEADMQFVAAWCIIQF